MNVSQPPGRSLIPPKPNLGPEPWPKSAPLEGLWVASGAVVATIAALFFWRMLRRRLVRSHQAEAAADSLDVTRAAAWSPSRIRRKPPWLRDSAPPGEQRPPKSSLSKRRSRKSSAPRCSASSSSSSKESTASNSRPNAPAETANHSRKNTPPGARESPG